MRAARTMRAVGAAYIKSMRFKLVLPASNGFAVSKLESESPRLHLNAG
jgi:hypothetical protein